MLYRIELKKTDRRYKAYDKAEYVYSREELMSYIFLFNIADSYSSDSYSSYYIDKIIKTTKDGRGYDVTNKYIKQ